MIVTVARSTMASWLSGRRSESRTRRRAQYPAEGALDHPAARQRVKPALSSLRLTIWTVSARTDFAQSTGRPGVAAVGPHQRDCGEALPRRAQQPKRGVAVLHRPVTTTTSSRQQQGMWCPSGTAGTILCHSATIHIT